MDVQVLPARELTERHCQRWEQIRADQPALSSPYLSASFTCTAAGPRDDLRVALLHQDGEILGFFPYQLSAQGEGLPVAFGLNDFHGPVISSDLIWTMEDLLRGCGLASWRFNHLIAEIPPLQKYHRLKDASPYIDVREGFEHYLEAKKAAGSSVCAKIATQTRRLERDVGTLRFVAAENDPALLDQLLRWKTEHLDALGKSHRFHLPWVRRLLADLRCVDTAPISGILSSLRAGKHLLAVHLGLRATEPGRGSWHYWIPAYNPSFARYSPGLILLLRTVRCAAEMGLERVDLGRGAQDYKSRLMTGWTDVAEGIATLGSGERSLTAAVDAGQPALRTQPVSIHVVHAPTAPERRARPENRTLP